MKKIKTYGEFLNLTVNEANEIVYEAMKAKKTDYSKELAKWIARVQTEHIFNSVKYSLDECETLYKFARGDGKINHNGYLNGIFDDME